MSYTEINIGKVREVDLCGKTPEEWAKMECERHGVNDLKGCDNWVEALNEIPRDNPDFRFTNKYIWTGDDRLFEILENKCNEASDDITIITPNQDGTYSYTMQFYNGGTCLEEILKDELDKLPKK